MEYLYIFFLILDAYLAYRFIRKDSTLRGKLLASVPFVGSGFYLTFVSGNYHSLYAWLIVAGLVFSFLGDWLLKYNAFGMKGLPGIISFAVAHIFYIAAYIVRVPLSASDLWLVFPWCIMIVLEIAAKKKMKINLGATAPAVLVYAMIINVMVIAGIRTAVCTMAGGVSALRSLMMIAGVIMFIVSDAGVCLMMFDGRTHFRIMNKTYDLDIFNIITYYGGQMLISAGVLV